jgi:hypothetical protein
MNKKKCSHCGYKFKPKEENQEICDLCTLQMRDDNASFGHKYEFDVKYLSSLEINGKLKLFPEKVVFEPKEVYFKDKKMELFLEKIKDVRFTAEKEITGLRSWLFGATLAAFLKKKHNLLTIDYEDEFGIILHPIFEGSDVDIALKELNEIRRNQKKGF